MINSRDSKGDLREGLGVALVIWCSAVTGLAVVIACRSLIIYFCVLHLISSCSSAFDGVCHFPLSLATFVVMEGK